MDAVSATNFVQSLEPIDRDSFADDATRREALSAARALCMRLESPMDTMTRLTFFEVNWGRCSNLNAWVHAEEEASRFSFLPSKLQSIWSGSLFWRMPRGPWTPIRWQRSRGQK